MSAHSLRQSSSHEPDMKKATAPQTLSDPKSTLSTLSHPYLLPLPLFLSFSLSPSHSLSFSLSVSLPLFPPLFPSPSPSSSPLPFFLSLSFCQPPQTGSPQSRLPC